MSIKKISCGGFKIDNKTIVEEDGILKSLSTSFVVASGVISYSNIRYDNTINFTIDKTYTELIEADVSGINIAIKSGTVIIDTVFALEYNKMSNVIIYKCVYNDFEFEIFVYKTGTNYIYIKGKNSEVCVGHFDVDILDIESIINTSSSLIVYIDKPYAQLRDTEWSVLKMRVLQTSEEVIASYYIPFMVRKNNGDYGEIYIYYGQFVNGTNKFNFKVEVDRNTAQLYAETVDNNNDFVITCTPTETDMSGTMDKTPSEIALAYKEGKNIRIAVPTAVNKFTEVIPESYNVTTVDDEVDAVSVYATFIYYADDGQGNSVAYLVQAYTSLSTQSYSTNLFPLNSLNP